MPNRRSQSFTKAEIDLACQLLKGVLSGGDLHVLAERPEFRRVTRRFLDMQQSIAAEQRAEIERLTSKTPVWAQPKAA